jgi:7tm Chemosensory receptor.
MIIGICWITFIIIRKIFITVFCSKATLEAKEILSNVQLALLHQPQTFKVAEQIKQFSTQITINEIKLTASGFFTLNLSTMSAFLATVITYIVVLMQIE